MTSPSTLRARHPRPTLIRDRFWPLTGSVPFRWDDAGDSLLTTPCPVERLTERIALPFPPESAASGINQTRTAGTLWYALTVPEAAVHAARNDGHSILLHLEAVHGRTRVWVGDSMVGEGELGYSRQTFDLTRLAPEPGDPLVVTVEVGIDHQDLSRPRGKQDWHATPHGIWYERSSGIWREPWIEVVPATHVTDVVTTTHLATDSITVEVELNRPAPAESMLGLDIAQNGQLLASVSTRVSGRHIVMHTQLAALQNEHERTGILWSPEHPNLVDIDLRLTTDHGEDRVCSYAGLREVGVQGPSFVLNDHPYTFRAVLDQYYWPASHFTAPSDGSREAEAALIRELGFNGVRLHQISPDPRFLYHCDRLGLLAWAEMPAAYRFDPASMRLVHNEWAGILRQSRAHPSVVTWVPFNESWGVHELGRRADQRAFVEGIVQLTKAADPTRPVISNDGWEHVNSDMLTFHDYAQDGAQLKARFAHTDWLDPRSGKQPFAGRRAIVSDHHATDLPVMLTEFGGITYPTARATDVWGYGIVRSPQEFEAGLRELIEAAMTQPSLAGWCYTQLADTLQEANGLLDENRNPKIPMEVIHEILAPTINP